MQKVILIFLLVVTGCTKKTPPERSAVFALKEMGNLATVEYNVTKIIKAADDKTWYKVGDRKILMSCEAYIKAGVDFQSLNETDISIDGKSISVNLPAPIIISLSIPPDRIKVEYEEAGFFRDPFTTAERDNLTSQGETQIRNSIDNLGILEQAKANTSLFISSIFKKMGYENIEVTYNKRKALG